MTSRYVFYLMAAHLYDSLSNSMVLMNLNDSFAPYYNQRLPSVLYRTDTSKHITYCEKKCLIGVLNKNLRFSIFANL
jgi:hypothetical protein